MNYYDAGNKGVVEDRHLADVHSWKHWIQATATNTFRITTISVISEQLLTGFISSFIYLHACICSVSQVGNQHTATMKKYDSGIFQTVLNMKRQPVVWHTL